MSPHSEKILVALAVASIAAAAMASETITYSYDARGRLVKVVRSGTVNNNVWADYKYDKGDNRTNVNVVSPIISNGTLMAVGQIVPIMPKFACAATEIFILRIRL